VSQRFYSDEEAEEILKVAANRQGQGGLDLFRLQAAASELGISPEALADAEAQVMREREERAQFEEYKRSKRQAFFNSLVTYIVVNAGLWIAMRPSWIVYVLGGWGIGLVSEGFKAFGGSRPGSPEFETWRQARVSGAVPGQIVGADAALEEFVSRGSNLAKLEAIKFVRERTGLGLRESKEAVDRFEFEHPNIFR
jgi:hypothetical protein